jgi:hypothetical protein
MEQKAYPGLGTAANVEFLVARTPEEVVVVGVP